MMIRLFGFLLAVVMLSVSGCSCSSSNSPGGEDGAADSPDESSNSPGTSDPLTQDELTSRDITIDVGNASPVTDQASVDVTIGSSSFTTAVTLFSDASCQTQITEVNVNQTDTVVSIPLGAVGSVTIYYTRTDTNGEVIACSASGLTLTRVGQPTFGLVYDNSVGGLENKWNYYVQAGDATLTCATNTSSPCIHAGIARKVELIGLTSCDGLSANDSVGVFRWRCLEQADRVVFESFDLGTGPGLSALIDLIEPTNFKSISVTITGGVDDITSESRNDLWDDTVTALPAPATPANLTASDTIYYRNTNLDVTGRYRFNGDRISLVTIDDATLTHNAVHTVQIIQTAASTNFLYLEADIVGNGSESLACISPAAAYFFRIHNTRMEGCGQNGYQTANSYQVVISNSIAANSGSNGISIAAGTNVNVTVQDSFISNNTVAGLVMQSGSEFYAFNNKVVNNGLNGIRFNSGSEFVAVNNVISMQATGGMNIDADDGIVVNTIAVGNDASGFEFGGLRNLGVNVTSVNNRTRGINIESGGDDATIINAITANNYDLGIEIDAANTDLYDVVSVNNRLTGLWIGGGATGGEFRGAVILGNNGVGAMDDCDGNPVGSNLDVGTCAITSLASEVTVVRNATATNSFTGLVTGGDSDNDDQAAVSGGGGQLVWDSITDFYKFSVLHRLWSTAVATTFIDETNADRCATGVNCGMWDMSLANGDLGDVDNARALLKDRFSCPTSEDTKSFAFSGATFGTLTFLENATEIVLDGYGNDNGLCESNEHCIYVRNIGAYQGHGSLVSSECDDIGSGGTIENVKLFDWSIR